MTTQDYKQGTGKSLDEIAALMASNRQQMQDAAAQRQASRKPGGAAKSAPLTQLGDEDEIEEAEVIEAEEEEDEYAEGDGELDTEEEEGGEGVSEVEDEDPDEEDVGLDDDEDAEDDAGTLEVDDETLVELEGEEKPVSLKDLKAAYLADKEIPKRLQAIEAEYQTAAQTRTKAVADGSKMTEAMQALIQAVDQVIAQPVAKKPMDALKTSNPAAYLQQLEAYQADQQRIAGSRQAVLEALTAHNNQLKEVKNNLKVEEMNVLLQKIPALKAEDAKLRAQASQDIIDASNFYGFSPDEVNGAADHRIFQMAYDAQQYRKLKSAGKHETKEKATALKKKVSQQPKVLRSGGTSAKNRVTEAAKRVKVLKSRAKTTGRPEDVAAFMSSTRQLSS